VLACGALCSPVGKRLYQNLVVVDLNDAPTHLAAWLNKMEGFEHQAGADADAGAALLMLDIAVSQNKLTLVRKLLYMHHAYGRQTPDHSCCWLLYDAVCQVDLGAAETDMRGCSKEACSNQD
jgi:hypothetical protein